MPKNMHIVREDLISSAFSANFARVSKDGDSSLASSLANHFSEDGSRRYRRISVIFASNFCNESTDNFSDSSESKQVASRPRDSSNEKC